MTSHKFGLSSPAPCVTSFINVSLGLYVEKIPETLLLPVEMKLQKATAKTFVNILF